MYNKQKMLETFIQIFFKIVIHWVNIFKFRSLFFQNVEIYSASVPDTLMTYSQKKLSNAFMPHNYIKKTLTGTKTDSNTHEYGKISTVLLKACQLGLIPIDSAFS